ncbi:MAG: hypothetical protein IJF02_01530 [Oscillospiraceae bacterium]|nr:hypothetical protein [Oscillospiraceae bacterium]
MDLAIKPQDLTRNFRNDSNVTGRIVDRAKLADPGLKAAYLSWYPLVAACSYIRVNKEEPFAAEYIIPQLLMQWARSEMQDTRTRKGQLIGIRYFSCSSVHASDMEFNYVFPTSGEQREDKPYCPILRQEAELIGFGVINTRSTSLDSMLLGLLQYNQAKLQQAVIAFRE